MRFIEGKHIKNGLFRHCLIFSFAFLSCQGVFSQVNLDSLQRAISYSTGEDLLKTFERLSQAYSYTDLDMYRKYSLDGYEYALSLGDSSVYLSKFLIELGYYNKLVGAYQEALNRFTQSVNVSVEKDYKLQLSAAYTGIGTVYHERALYDRALDYHSRSLALSEELNDKIALSVSYNNIGLIYYKMDDPERALENYTKSLDLKLQAQDTARCIINYINIGLAYSEMPDPEQRQQAVQSFKTSIDLSKKYEQIHRLGYAYNGLANVFASLDEYDSAKHYLNISIEESIRKNYKLLESSNYYLLAKIAYLERQYSVALNYLERSQALLIKLEDKSRIKNNYRLYSDVFEATNMIDSAFYYQKKYSTMKDSIFNEELANNLANVQISAATYQQEKTIIQQKETISKGQLLALFLSFILALSIALIFVIFRNYANTNRINKQLNESKSEIEAQKEDLEKKNQQLAEAQVTIQKQNEVLKNINIDLDKKVKERTVELDRSNHELEKAVKDLDQFIYKTSHDLRGPIATMQGIINLGVMDAGDERSKEYFNTLHKVSNNLNNVLFRLIEVHETYQKKPELQNLDPMREIIDTTNRVSQFSIDNDVTVITELQANGQWTSDKVLFNLIIENMLRSAMLYKDRDEPTIKIRSQYKNEKLNIIFEDNGFGIHPGDEDKVFNIFFKGSPRPGGTGLEIYTAKIAAEKLGGEIKLVKPIKNTVFEINLPLLGV